MLNKLLGYKEEDLIWIGDGIMPEDTKRQIGRIANIGGKIGKVIGASDLFITIQWEPKWISMLKKYLQK